MTRPGGSCESSVGVRLGGDLAAGTDGAAAGSGQGRGRNREDGVHQREPGAGRGPELHRRRVQLAVPEVPQRPTTPGYSAAAPRDQEDRHVEAAALQKRQFLASAGLVGGLVLGQYAWLREHAARFRFYESWLPGNEFGMRAEPWHWQHRQPPRKADLG
jgi:hypothetical protein